MKKETYDKIKNSLEEHLNNCKKHLDNVLTTEDLSNLTIKEFVELKAFAKREQREMTEICMIDVYHILGMGDLDTIQLNGFVRVLKEYLSYRSDLKAISNMKNIDSLPSLPSRSKFKLHVLGDVTLESKLRGSTNLQVEAVEEEEVTISTYHEQKKSETETQSTESAGSIKMDGNFVTFNLEDINKFILALNATWKPEKIIKACESKIGYGDFIWEFDNDKHSVIRGCALNKGIRDSVRNRLILKGILI